ncbi:hypothetical protein BLNAU_2126 [Blattamonas nauphoetae]|uniref:Uncharacterized protein n=1 Tax=Blattamonas nauphoetae TaxID=2049346 RepID=A0ABQ9YH61_9EUKA|nr:hypothetical protein BLNAU_2126 [Blattamonas nauphoetae]
MLIVGRSVNSERMIESNPLTVAEQGDTFGGVSQKSLESLRCQEAVQSCEIRSRMNRRRGGTVQPPHQEYLRFTPGRSSEDQQWGWGVVGVCEAVGIGRANEANPELRMALSLFNVEEKVDQLLIIIWKLSLQRVESFHHPGQLYSNLQNRFNWKGYKLAFDEAFHHISSRTKLDAVPAKQSTACRFGALLPLHSTRRTWLNLETSEAHSSTNQSLYLRIQSIMVFQMVVIQLMSAKGHKAAQPPHILSSHDTCCSMAGFQFSSTYYSNVVSSTNKTRGIPQENSRQLIQKLLENKLSATKWDDLSLEILPLVIGMQFVRQLREGHDLETQLLFHQQPSEDDNIITSMIEYLHYLSQFLTNVLNQRELLLHKPKLPRVSQPVILICPAPVAFAPIPVAQAAVSSIIGPVGHFMDLISMEWELRIRSQEMDMPVLQFYQGWTFDTGGRSHFKISDTTITRTGVDKDQNWSTTLFDQPISEGVVSVAITILAIPEADSLSLSFGKCSESEEGLMVGLVDALSRTISNNDQLGDDFPSVFSSLESFSSRFIRFHRSRSKTWKSPSEASVHRTIRANNPHHWGMSECDQVALEVDMDARPRTAVFIINGNVPITFVSGLPPSIRFGLSMKNEGVSVRFDGISRLKQATPLRRVNEIKWNADELSDSEDMYMNGMRSSVLTVQTQMPSLLFSEPITEGIVAISFTYLVTSWWNDSSFFGLMDGTMPILEIGERFGSLNGSIGISPAGKLFYLASDGPKSISGSSRIDNCEPLVVEINMDSNPRTAQFFVSREPATAVVVDLPESVRVGFSAMIPGMQFRFDRITNLNRDSPITEQMTVLEWPTVKQLQATQSEKDSATIDEAKMLDSERREGKDSTEEDRIDENVSDEKTRRENNGIHNDKSPHDFNKANDATVDGGEVADEEIDHSSKQMMNQAQNDEDSEGDSEDNTNEEKSQSENDSDNEDDAADVEKKRRQLSTMKLPELLFTDKSHFIIRNHVLTRTEKGTDKKGRTRPSTVLFSEPITKGVVSVTFVVVTLTESMGQDGFINFGILDSSLAVPRLGKILGKNMKHSVALSTWGDIHLCNQDQLRRDCCSSLSKNDPVVMEVDMDSTPRTVQFFKNGKAGRCYVSGIPESVRFGFSLVGMGTSLEIVGIIHCTQPTPLTDKMKEIKWTDTEQLLQEREKSQNQPIRREADGLMPALLFRNPEHFKIEENVITRTAFDSDGLNSPFSTVLLDIPQSLTFKCVTITILALPQTETSFALCSLDGMIHCVDRNVHSKTCHVPLQVGDEVLLQVNTYSQQDISRFFVNERPGRNDISYFSTSLTIGLSLAGAGTSIRIDAFSEPNQTSRDDSDIADLTETNEAQDSDKATTLTEVTTIAETTEEHTLLSASEQVSQQPQCEEDSRPAQHVKSEPKQPPALPPKVPARDHPSYQPFFEKLKGGKKAVFLAPEMRVKGLNPEALSDHDMLV